jgi:hypothetical protein
MGNCCCYGYERKQLNALTVTERNVVERFRVVERVQRRNKLKGQLPTLKGHVLYFTEDGVVKQDLSHNDDEMPQLIDISAEDMFEHKHGKFCLKELAAEEPCRFRFPAVRPVTTTDTVTIRNEVV